MTRGQYIIEEIKNIFADIREKYPLITDKDLHNKGAIFYMNGNDGTDFDWNVNGRCCEFYMYHENEIGFIKLCVNVGDTYTAYVFPNGEMKAVETIKGNLDEGDSLYLAAILLRKADMNLIWDEDIKEIDFSYEPKEWELQDMNDEYEEDEEW